MTADLVTDVELAATMRLPLDKFHRLRRRNGWPCVKFGRTEIRFTPEQVDQIVAIQTITPTTTPTAPAKGQTRRSAARKRAS